MRKCFNLEECVSHELAGCGNAVTPRDGLFASGSGSRLAVGKPRRGASAASERALSCCHRVFSSLELLRKLKSSVLGKTREG